ncbi:MULTISPECIES: hypothetical protein [Rhodococcus]|uniref:Uncharacterized protein n=1 Tax=Rhodococcus opacus RKJ300 = JCM 13270 TaxID=1165867 RepID=I0WZD2_RHOOP|nr:MULTISPECIES: hypothetical protein [Rhodococcus]EID81748.1 hypothetical protein W59_01219 [Rhodococcus opacus RKJ300 = JCM 13270]QQZ18715.1 hypothetical protein GO592_34730 [Rhodococcus sp. 21391]
MVVSEGGLNQLGRNIAGRIHLCLAVDQIDAHLRRPVEHLHEITLDDIQVTAMQLTYARHGDLEILTPPPTRRDRRSRSLHLSQHHHPMDEGSPHPVRLIDILVAPLRVSVIRLNDTNRRRGASR